MRRDPESCKVVRVSLNRRCKSLVKNVLVKYRHNSMLSLFEKITKNSGSSGQRPVFYNFVIIVKSSILICNFSRFSYKANFWNLNVRLNGYFLGVPGFLLQRPQLFLIINSRHKISLWTFSEYSQELPKRPHWLQQEPSYCAQEFFLMKWGLLFHPKPLKTFPGYVD